MTEHQLGLSKKYRTIVIDPPWEMKILKRKVRPNQVEMPYKVMTIDEIKNFDIKQFEDDECVIFLWTTHKYLPKAFEILEHWGFNYHVTGAWDKQDGMCLAGFHRRTEFWVFGYKGKLEMFPHHKAFPTIIVQKNEQHSKKPSEFYRHVKESFPEPRIDIFARTRHEGFDAWGDQVENETQKVLA